jgi:MFS family permease
METTHEQADPVAKGVIATAKQSWHDLFTFKQRIVVATGPHGEALATEWARPAPLQNPIRQLATLTPRAWLFFLVGLAAWTADAFDFHALAIQQVVLAEYYSTTKTKLSTAITLTLLLRSVGAAGFGLAGDRFGRKWPMVINMWVLGLLQIATIYSQTLGQFLAVRSLSGLFMGGVYGNAIAMALENVPADARGIVSGILQQGYALGYIFASAAILGINGNSGRSDGWKAIFWIATSLSMGVGIVRCLFPESKQFIEARKGRKTRKDVKSASSSISGSGSESAPTISFWAETKEMLARVWKMCLYCIILMTWFNCE